MGEVEAMLRSANQRIEQQEREISYLRTALDDCRAVACAIWGRDCEDADKIDKIIKVVNVTLEVECPPRDVS